MSSKYLRIVMILLLVAGIIMAVMFRDQFDAATLEDWVKGAGAAGPVIFLLLYIIGTVMFLPGSALTLAGGALFGPYLGTFLNLTGATLGATIAFIIARYLAADWVEQKTAGRLKQLKDGVEAEGWKFVAFVRLVPLFPFNLLNYALGLTRIRILHYVAATYVFMFPGAVAYTYLGYAGREAVAGSEDLIQKGLLALALLALVAFIPRLLGQLRKGPMLDVTTLKQLLGEGDETRLIDVRTAADFNGEMGHIADAVNIPLEELDARLQELTDDMHLPIAIICTTDRRSARAARILLRNGYTDVSVVSGGMTDWNAHGFPHK